MLDIHQEVQAFVDQDADNNSVFCIQRNKDKTAVNAIGSVINLILCFDAAFREHPELAKFAIAALVGRKSYKSKMEMMRFKILSRIVSWLLL